LTDKNFILRAVEITRRIKKENPFNSFINVNPEVESRAKDIYGNIKKGKIKKLSGYLVGIKDNICVKNIPTTCGSKILHNFIPPYEATVVEKIKEEDGLIIGKTNLDEFAMGSSSEYSYYGPVRNPHNETKVPGGSSGGSAASVSGDLVDVALGSDTGGSIRQPAAFCGTIGLKPTYGRVSRYGLVAFASSLDQIGIFSKTIKDTTTLLSVIAGVDSRDSTSVDIAVPDYLSFLGKDIKGIRIGIPDEYFVEGLNPEIEQKIKEYIKFLEGSGAYIEKISLPHTAYAIATYYIIATAEASSNLARYDGIRYGLSKRGGDLESVYRKTRHSGFGQEVTRRIMLGTYVLSAGYYEAYYDKAQRVRRLIKSDFVKAFKSVDVIFTPTTPTTAFEIGGKIDNPLEMYLSDIYTVPASLAGLPAMNIPLGFSGEGLPIGGQLIGNYFREEVLLNLGYFIEQNYSK
jgi:aspartyl-tRNA(Asn)/glutamyl-tRNA(Gln) amidotransferase subunit A